MKFLKISLRFIRSIYWHIRTRECGEVVSFGKRIKQIGNTKIGRANSQGGPMASFSSGLASAEQSLQWLGQFLPLGFGWQANNPLKSQRR